jgi:predicted ABC-type ATPase
MLSVDDAARTLEPANPDIAVAAAQVWVDQKREQLLLNMDSFCYETVFSHPSKIDVVAQAKGHGYFIILTYIHLKNAALNLARVHQRVSEGGHNVPPEKTVARIPRTMMHVGKAIKLVDEVQLLDNSSHSDAFKQIADVTGGIITPHVDPLPKWATRILGL